MSTLAPLRPVARDEETLVSEFDAHRRFFALLDYSPAFSALLVGEELRFEYSNHAHDALIGGRPSLGRPLCEAVPEAKAIGLADGIAGVLSSGEPFAVSDLSLELTTGHRRVNVLLQPFLDRCGNVVGVFVQGFEITDRSK